MRPGDGDYGGHFGTYVGLVPEEDILPALEAQVGLIGALPSRVGPARELFAYGPGKWSVREVMGHMTDVERVFAYRVLVFSRFDQAGLPGFDENAYVEHARFNGTPLASLVEEFLLLRRANLEMLRRLEEAQWASRGLSSNREITVRALAYVMAGHVRHHLAILRDRYGIE